jgi:hypothetical protein
VIIPDDRMIALKRLTMEDVEAIRERLGDRHGVNAVCDAALAWLSVRWSGAEDAADFLEWKSRKNMTQREITLIKTLNPTVLGEELVRTIQRVTGVQP